MKMRWIAALVLVAGASGGSAWYFKTKKKGPEATEVETEKATVEFESLAAGRLAEIVHEAGATVEIGAVIAYLEADD